MKSFMTLLVLSAGFCMTAGPTAAYGQVYAVEGKHYPEDDGWLRSKRVFPASRWLQDGWIYFRTDHAPTLNNCAGGESEYYRKELLDLIGAERLFIEWRSITDGEGDPVRFGMSNRHGMHFGADAARDRLRVSTPAGGRTVDSAPGEPHMYRLDIYEGNWFEWTQDGDLVIAGRPGGLFLQGTPFVVWGVAASCTDVNSAMDYFRVGVPPSRDIACDAIESLDVKCRNGRVRARLESDLEPGTTLTLTNNGVHRKLRIDDEGRAKTHYREQTGEHTLLLLDCPAISQEVDCGE